ncbi:MAG: hypothetical protein HY934_06785 [Candidatus Firestonebacteria bacterium]|nr:hypothetical protein [Candidatus Firestonebacteria bacterium]
MNSNIIKSLLALQDIDKKILKLKERIGAIPKEIEEIEKKIQMHYNDLSENKKGMDVLLKKRKDIEFELASNNTKLTKLNEQLYSLKSNKEYTAMLKEINDIKNGNEKFEEKIIEIMLSCDNEKEKYKSIEKSVLELEALNQKEKEEKLKEKSNLESILDGKLKDRNELINTLDNKNVSIYDKIFEHKGSHAVVEIKGEVCQGCHVGIPPQMINILIISDELCRCPNCARIIYLERLIKSQ